MDIMYTPKEMKRVAQSRDSFSGRLLSDPHYDEAMMVTGIIEKEIQSTGRFKEVLNEYSAAYAHTKKNLSVVNAEKIMRDLFKERTGLSMNEMRESFVQREESLSQQQRTAAFPYAKEVGSMIEQGNKISFHRAFSHQAKQYATELNITDLGAKRIMSQQFEAVQKRETSPRICKTRTWYGVFKSLIKSNMNQSAYKDMASGKHNHNSGYLVQCKYCFY